VIRNCLRRTLIALPLIVSTLPLPAQQMITHEKPLRLRHLAGTVVDPKGMTIPYALIELRDPGDDHVIASTFADGNGKFSFADRKRNESFELRISLAGFQVTQYNISIAIVGKDHMRVVLQTAS
jgi:hypothetical protein